MNQLRTWVAIWRRSSFWDRRRVLFGASGLGFGSGVYSLCLSRVGKSENTYFRHVQRFRGGLVFKAHRRCVSLNSRLESNNEEEEKVG